MAPKNKSVNRILIISSEFPPGPGGIGNHAYNLARNLQLFDDVEVTVMADTNFTSTQELKDFDQRNHFKIFRIFRSKIILLTYLRRIVLAARLIAKHDKVLCSGKFPLWIGGLFKPVFTKKEFVAVAHGSELDLKNPLAKKYTNYAIKKFDKVVSVSAYTQGFLPADAKKQQRTIIANGIDLEEIHSEANDDSFSSENGSISLLTVGNVTPRKGQKNVIKALPEIKKVFPDVHYHIVGLPTHMDSFLAFAKELDVESNITFHGKVNRSELLKMYKNCDIFMMLSDHTADGDFEGFGIAVLEANLWKKPAIGSARSGIADAIDNGKTGMLVDQHNPDEITKAITDIKQNYASFCRQAFQWALKHDWKVISKKYYDFIIKQA